MSEPIRHEAPTLRRVASTSLPTEWGTFGCLAYELDGESETQLALTMGDVATGGEVLVRLHSECLTGDVFASRRCDCGPQLHEAMRRIGAVGHGVVVYLRGHEGRGIGIGQKLRAYALQDQGRDTVDANLDLGLPVDSRDYTVGALILRDLGVERVRLMTNNPRKQQALLAAGISDVQRVPLLIDVNDDNRHYLTTKRERLGHTLPSAGQ